MCLGDSQSLFPNHYQYTQARQRFDIPYPPLQSRLDPARPSRVKASMAPGGHPALQRRRMPSNLLANPQEWARQKRRQIEGLEGQRSSRGRTSACLVEGLGRVGSMRDTVPTRYDFIVSLALSTSLGPASELRESQLRCTLVRSPLADVARPSIWFGTQFRRKLGTQDPIH
ncbi:hypothetical protein BV25DRAFT_758377 [Artomyces pyxidatus]|uniref:Uncharacterized protein n=1 Tax=Artomyces pyxidatus TaxID=48021 RepID=A0ACB8SZD8_9AGAM|nr:hypothetical protein BV25DRAFT_758377 [Artomyces pyxidatus]